MKGFVFGFILILVILFFPFDGTSVLPAGRAFFSEQASKDRQIKPVKHIVLVWLKNPEDNTARQKLIETSHSFKEIPGVISVSAGTPLESERPVVDDSFDIAVVITFESSEAMEKYETHPIHTRAVKEVLRPLTDRMVIYDFVEEGG